MRRLVAAGLLLVGWGGGAALAVGETAGPGGSTPVSRESEALSPAQQRTLERRRERERERERWWIEVPTLRPEELHSRLGGPELAVIDVTCRDKRDSLSGKIPGASWEEWNRVAEWAPRYPAEKTLVVYCA